MLKKLWKFLFLGRTKNRRCRYLTNAEKQIAYSVFGDNLHLENIQLKTAWWVLKGYAVSPNGHIYYHHQDWQEDFSQASLGKRAWLIHELTHVWQVQQGICVFCRALLNRKYRYQLKIGKNFLAYGVEQQARMVEDFYFKREQNKNCDDLKACIPFLRETDVTNTKNPQ